MLIHSTGNLYCQNLKAKIGSRGMGIKNTAKPSIHLLLNWQEFLLLDENKAELFYLLAKIRVKSSRRQEASIYRWPMCWATQFWLRSAFSCTTLSKNDATDGLNKPRVLKCRAKTNTVVQVIIY